MENKSIGLLLTAFVMILIGVSLIGTTAGETQRVTTYTGVVSNEVHKVLSPYASGRNNTHINTATIYTVTNAPTGWKTESCPLKEFVLTNSTGAVLEETTGYAITLSTGKYTLTNDAGTVEWLPTSNNNTYASYKYCADDYVVAGWTRTVLNLVPGFFAIALLLVGVGLAFSVLKAEGIINI